MYVFLPSISSITTAKHTTLIIATTDIIKVRAIIINIAKINIVTGTGFSRI